MYKNNTLFCFRCYHTWKGRKEGSPKSCPKCHSPYWNKPRKRVSREIILKMKELITNIHNTIIKISGGELGIRDDAGIYNSTYKLINHQYKNQRNPTSIGAFALNEFAKRHYFVDGNKRTAYAIAKIFMLINKCHLKTPYLEATEFILQIAEHNSKVTLEQIKAWLENRSTKITERDMETFLSKTFTNITLGEDENEPH